MCVCVCVGGGGAGGGGGGLLGLEVYNTYTVCKNQTKQTNKKPNQPTNAQTTKLHAYATVI